MEGEKELQKEKEETKLFLNGRSGSLPHHVCENVRLGIGETRANWRHTWQRKPLEGGETNTEGPRQADE